MVSNSATLREARTGHMPGSFGRVHRRSGRLRRCHRYVGVSGGERPKTISCGIRCGRCSNDDRLICRLISKDGRPGRVRSDGTFRKMRSGFRSWRVSSGITFYNFSMATSCVRFRNLGRCGRVNTQFHSRSQGVGIVFQ